MFFSVSKKRVLIKDSSLNGVFFLQESKYLGGDMEHTHLVKGLDYSLLHKVS